MPQTLTKSEAIYVEHPVQGEKCADCMMFRKPHGCTLVKGEISREGHCRYWEEE